jgi:hypothetical protein
MRHVEVVRLVPDGRDADASRAMGPSPYRGHDRGSVVQIVGGERGRRQDVVLARAPMCASVRTQQRSLWNAKSSGPAMTGWSARTTDLRNGTKPSPLVAP